MDTVMPWIKQKKIDKQVHVCVKPIIASAATPGDIWQCGDCGNYYRVVNIEKAFNEWKPANIRGPWQKVLNALGAMFTYEP